MPMPLSGVNPMTEEKKRLSDMKTTSWAITYWLTEGRNVETLQELTQAMPTDWSVEGQIEQGHDSDDKLHAQLMLKTPQTRGSRIAKFFPNCHISEARNKFALKLYVHKDDTRKAEFKTIENRSPQWSVVVDKFFDWLVVNETYSQHETDELIKYTAWDTFIGLSIEDGMRIDVIGVNPQYRSCVNKYWANYYRVALSRAPPVDRQTDKTESTPTTSPGGGITKVKKVRSLVLAYE